MRRTHLILAVALAVTIVVPIAVYSAASARSLPIKAGTDRWFYGHLKSGSRFSFEVGTKFVPPESNAHNSRIRYYGMGSYKGTYKSISGCANDNKHASFAIDRSLYHGQVFLELDATGKIAAIIWNADLFPLEWAI